MKVLIVGAGPAGLSFATLLAQSNPSHDITVLERNPAGEDPGWGVTLRNYALSFVGLDKKLSLQVLKGRACWYRGELAVDLPYPPTDGLATISRTALQKTLVECCVDVGVRISFDTDGSRLSASDLAAYDLVVAADGRNSPIRQLHAEVFRPEITQGRNHYSWLAVEKPFDTLTILLEDGDLPMLAWAYKYTETLSTFVVETTGKTAEGSLSQLSPSDACKAIGKAFERVLGGARILCPPTIRWQPFPTIACERLQHGNIALIGDAAHTTHFSQGFGTMFAFDDALALHAALTETASVEQGLARYEAVQRPKIANLQELASASMRWSEATVDALALRDEARVGAQIEARWPNNAMPPAPMDSYSTPPAP